MTFSSSYMVHLAYGASRILTPKHLQCYPQLSFDCFLEGISIKEDLRFSLSVTFISLLGKFYLRSQKWQCLLAL